MCFFGDGWGANKGEAVESIVGIKLKRRCPIEQSYQSHMEWLLWVLIG